MKISWKFSMFQRINELEITMGFLSAIFDKSERLNRKAFYCGISNDFKQAISLINDGANVNHVDKVNYGDWDISVVVRETLGHVAIKKGNITALRALLDLGLNPEIKSSEGTTLIAEAVKQRNEEAANLLLDYGASTNFTFEDLDTLEDRAKKNSMTSTVSRLSKGEADSVGRKAKHCGSGRSHTMI